MKKKPTIAQEIKQVTRPISGRFTPREASPHGKIAAKKPVATKKQRYVTPNPFSPKGTAAKTNAFSKEGILVTKQYEKGKLLGDRKAMMQLAREKSPKKLVTLASGNDPLTKITSIINSPRNNELRYVDALGTRSMASGIGNMKTTNTIMASIKSSLKENENLKKIREYFY